MFAKASTFGPALSAAPPRSEGREGEVLIAQDGHIYKLAGILGKGGLSNVYRAIRFSDGEVVALKIADTYKAEEAGELLRREAEILKRMNHESIVKILDGGFTRDGQPFIVMELLTGQTLEEILRTHTRLPLKRAFNICLQVASALDYAHQQGFIHKDIKPANIIIQEEHGRDKAVLCDFGIATMVDACGTAGEESSSGSLMYAAPEQMSDIPCSFSTDVYQLALVFFQLLTGRLPFDLSVSAALNYRRTGPLLIDDEDLENCSIPIEIRRVLESALQRNPAARTATMRKFGDSLYQAVLELRSMAAGPMSRVA